MGTKSLEYRAYLGTFIATSTLTILSKRIDVYYTNSVQVVGNEWYYGDEKIEYVITEPYTANTYTRMYLGSQSHTIKMLVQGRTATDIESDLLDGLTNNSYNIKYDNHTIDMSLATAREQYKEQYRKFRLEIVEKGG